MHFVMLCIILLLLTFKPVFSAIEFNMEHYNHPTLVCITKIQTKYYQDHTVIISSTKLSSDILFKFEPRTTALLYSGKSLQFPKLFYKFHYFIFIINHSEELAIILNSLYGTELWNSRGKYIIGYFGNDDFGQIFEIAWQYYIYNIDVITTDGNVTNIYTYFPFKNKSRGEYMDYDLLGSCNNENIGEIYPEKIPLDYNGYTFRIMAYPMPPYVLNVSAPREKPELAGIEVTILHVLGQRLNFTNVYIQHSHKFWGFKDPGGTYHYMFRSLYDKECDIIFGMTAGNASHIVDFDGATVHLQDTAIWWVPVALPIPQWKNVTAIFDGNVWLTILVVFLVNGFAWWFIGKSREPADSYNDLVLSIMSSLYSLLQGSIDSPVTWKLRFMVILWLMTCLLIFTAHQCQLVSILTSPLYEHQITTLEEAVNSTLEFGLFVGAAEGYDDHKNWIYEKIFKNYVQCPLSTYCINRTAFARDLILLKNARNIRYLIPRLFTDRNGKSLVYPLEDHKIEIWCRFHVFKGFPFLYRFNDLIRRMQESGFIAKWNKEISYETTNVESDSEQEPLNINHLQAAFYILFIGLCLAFFVFICENIHKYKCKKS